MRARSKTAHSAARREPASSRGSCLATLLLHWARGAFPHQIQSAWAWVLVLAEAARWGSGLPVHNSSDSLPWGSAHPRGLCSCGLESAQSVFLQAAFHMSRQTSCWMHYADTGMSARNQRGGICPANVHPGHSPFQQPGSCDLFPAGFHWSCPTFMLACFSTTPGSGLHME